MAFKPNAKGKQVSRQQQRAKAAATVAEAEAEAEAEASSSGASSSGALKKRASERYSKPLRRASSSTRSVKQQGGPAEPSPDLPEKCPQELAREQKLDNVVVPQPVTGALGETSGKSRPAPRRSAWEFEDTVWGYKENLDGVLKKQAAPAAHRVTKADGTKKAVKEKRTSEITCEEDMTEEIDKHVLRKYHVCQKLGKGVTTVAR